MQIFHFALVLHAVYMRLIGYIAYEKHEAYNQYDE